MTPVNRRVIQELILLLTAIFAVAWAIARAALQSLTIDEADTYLFFGSRELAMVWHPSSNNHVLNSLLMWITTHFFGTAGVTVRAPALLGAILYTGVCYFLCRTITNRFSLCLPLLICLTYNPLIMDFMVAGRGYGLADALLVTAIAIPVWHHLNEGISLSLTCMLASLALGLSFASSFSFAFVDLAAFMAIFVWAIRRPDNTSRARIASCCVLPGLLTAALLCGYPLAHWRNDDSLGMGARSLGDSLHTIIKDSMFQLTPQLMHSGLYTAMNFLKPLLLPVLVILCLCQLVVTHLDGSWLRDARERWRGRFGAALVGIAALSLAMHWLAFRAIHLPLPLGRKAIYLIPLLTLSAGVLAAGPVRSSTSRWLRQGMTSVFICLACYFLLCLRLSYFEEWQWDADVKDVYSALAKYNHKFGIADVGTSWFYVSSLNFYRVASGSETFPEFMAGLPQLPEGKAAYVLNGVFDREFLEKEKLVIIYHGKMTDVVIAVKPETLALGRMRQ
jgi:hypothetical protein